MTKSAEREADGQVDNSTSPLEELRGELGNYVGARAQHLADSVGDKLTSFSMPSTNGDGSGILSLGKRVLSGENPVKAVVSEKAKGAKDKVVGGVKDAIGGGDGTAGDTKVTNMVEVIDIGRPLRFVYDHWTQFEEFGSFAKGVSDVTMSDEVESDWKLKVAFSNRNWKATVQEQVPDERIVWDSEGDRATTHGAISFHELTPDLTRVVVVVEYRPSGFFEKTGNLWRAQGRRLRLDLKHFQRYVTLTDEEPEGWRGEIRDSEVVRTHEEALEDEDADAGADADTDDEYDDDEEEAGEDAADEDEEYAEDDEDDT
ncbi:SRPBCC family protein [Streptomyces sp. NBC_01477]|uniref:SRPBCC family protein n=1 Tax=Streptomyces sp. NBC_01477 TaxID=2976015 RepID=UPI002E309BED|nr:SRPBCC family protein [Streptomyces sp. NBC_01477]